MGDCRVRTRTAMKNHLPYSKSKIWSLKRIYYICLMSGLFFPTVKSSTFSDNFYISWGNVKIEDGGETVQLTLDKASGSGFTSKSNYLFGRISMKIKLVAGDSAGIVTAYYMSSETASAHDEIDFEFLGNVAGQPYILQTNLFSRGNGNREQRIHLWFDPTAEFHTYSILWNHYQIVYFVDSTPIRVFKNNEAAGVPYPNSQPLRIFNTLWNGEDWATDGGKEKIDWSYAPFIASFQGFEVDACIAAYNSTPPCASWWDQSQFQTLTQKQLIKLKWVRENSMIYDYCKDTKRFPRIPTECALNP